MFYTVKYKTAKSLFWTTLKEVKMDGIMTSESNFPMRFFVTSSEERIEVPIPGTKFWFSRDRFLSIKQKMEQEAGFDIKLRT